MSDSRWYFTEEQLANSPSRKCGINAEQELSQRQRAANLIQEMGQRLQVSQLCINTAIVYMHRFYAFHSFTLFHRNNIAAAAFFLAAKVEEQPRKLEHVIKILNICLEKSENSQSRENYVEQAQELVFNENVLLQTLGFDVAIDHPHTHVVRACQLFNIVTVSRELRQTCYFMASNSLHLTTMCLKYRPTVVAAFCIYIACKWSRWEIPDSSEGRAWYSYVDENVTPDILKKLTDEYLQILERSPSKFKSKMKAITSNGQTAANTNPSVHSRDDGPSTTHHKSHPDKHHHHHRTNSNSSNSNRKQPGEVTLSSSAPVPLKQPQQGSSQSSSSNYKNQSISQPTLSSSSSQMQRQRTNSNQQQPYPGNESTSTQKPVNEDRTQHRQTVPEAASFNSSMLPRPIDPHKQRMGSGQPLMTSSSSQQQPNQQPHSKPSNHDQRHSLSSKPQVDYHQKNMKHPQTSSSGSADFQNRGSFSSSHSQPQQQAQQMSHKKPSWPQQQPSSHPSNLQQKPGQSHVQSSHTQPNLNTSSSNNRNNPQALPTYNESTKQSSSSQPTTQNDYWYNDKLLEPAVKAISPLRQSKSMFSPSPEHEGFDKTKMLMMAANAKRNDSPKSDKQDRRSSTPSKREKRAELSTTPTSQKSSQVDRKQPMIKLENSGVPPLIPDAGSQMKKRPFSSVEETGEFNRESKSRRLEPVKTEPSVVTGVMMKQPIETNPEIVKTLLKECYKTNKFGSFGMDSPLDVINPDPAMATSSYQTQPKNEMLDSMLLKQEPRDNGFEEDHHKRNKSKKKKEKHRKKEKKKSHKSDREDREDRKDTPIKIILSKDKADSKSSPESLISGGLKIKIPIKDVNKTDLTGAPPMMHPAPLKLKISKEKIGGFNNAAQNLSDGGSSSSSSHKKKDKDRSKSKSSKHGNNNNNSDYKDAGYQHQQLSLNKMSTQVPMQSQGAYDMSLMFGNDNMPQPGFYHHQQQQHQLQQMPIVNPQQQQLYNYNNYYQNPNMNYPNNYQNSGNKK